MILISQPFIGDEEKNAVLEVLSSGIVAQGPKVQEFEDRFAGYIGTEHAVATNSGTAALHTALLACGISMGDEVITTPFSFIASANSVLYCGAKPIFADIDPKTFNIDPEEVKEKIGNNTKALLIVHLFGQPCEMDAIMEICQDHKLVLIEDACQAHGAEYDMNEVGGFGRCAAFSFYPTKNMTTGEGGMITTNDKIIAGKARLLREHGSKTRYHHDALGYNYRMTDIAAAIGIEQLKKLEGMNERRIENAKDLTKGIKKIKGLASPYISPMVKHVFHQYTIRVNEEYGITRGELVKKLSEKGIGSSVYYPLPIPSQELYKTLGYESRFPKAEQASKEVLSLPVHPKVSEREIELILSALTGN
ncbi:MAG: DegT/DnrJ/EryC1/StrS family aminotransferase [Desulfatiglandales bacterium]